VELREERLATRPAGILHDRVLAKVDHVQSVGGQEPEWVEGALTLSSRAQLRLADLHFHDLRHEAGCRWLELGWRLHHIQEMLGHANLSQTSTYPHAPEMGLQESMRRFDSPRGNPLDRSSCGASASWPMNTRHKPAKARYTSSCGKIAPVAQRIEHPPPKRGAAGSIPAGRAKQ
jgi:hypothetical protein